MRYRIANKKLIYYLNRFYYTIMDLLGYIESAEHKIMLIEEGGHKTLPFMHISEDDDPIESFKQLILRVSGIDISWYDIVQSDNASNNNTCVYTVSLEDRSSGEITENGNEAITWEGIDSIDYNSLTKETERIVKAIN